MLVSCWYLVLVEKQRFKSCMNSYKTSLQNINLTVLLVYMIINFLLVFLTKWIYIQGVAFGTAPVRSNITTDSACYVAAKTKSMADYSMLANLPGIETMASAGGHSSE